jgi:hypothetical protein
MEAINSELAVAKTNAIINQQFCWNNLLLQKVLLAINSALHMYAKVG